MLQQLTYIIVNTGTNAIAADLQYSICRNKRNSGTNATAANLQDSKCRNKSYRS